MDSIKLKYENPTPSLSAFMPMASDLYVLRDISVARGKFCLSRE